MRHLWSRQRQVSRTRLAGVGVVSLLAFGLLYLVGIHTASGRWVDEALHRSLVETLPISVRQGLMLAGRLLTPLVLALVASALALRAVWLRRWRPVGEAVLITVISVIAAYALRTEWLPRVASAVTDRNGYPSTHAAAGLSLLTAVAILWFRRPGALGRVVFGFVALLVMLGNVTWQAHRPLDVIGSALLVTAVTCVVGAASRRDGAARPPDPGGASRALPRAGAGMDESSSQLHDADLRAR
ncbi:MAG: phosphatase PAP2 family protein [Micrococcales bacterium]|nr:phosphatase PAP2 family protein [Micrococcales bacterium]